MFTKVASVFVNIDVDVTAVVFLELTFDYVEAITN